MSGYVFYPSRYMQRSENSDCTSCTTQRLPYFLDNHFCTRIMDFKRPFWSEPRYQQFKVSTSRKQPCDLDKHFSSIPPQYSESGSQQFVVNNIAQQEFNNVRRPPIYQHPDMHRYGKPTFVGTNNQVVQEGLLEKTQTECRHFSSPAEGEWSTDYNKRQQIHISSNNLLPSTPQVRIKDVFSLNSDYNKFLSNNTLPPRKHNLGPFPRTNRCFGNEDFPREQNQVGHFKESFQKNLNTRIDPECELNYETSLLSKYLLQSKTFQGDNNSETTNNVQHLGGPVNENSRTSNFYSTHKVNGTDNNNFNDECLTSTLNSVTLSHGNKSNTCFCEKNLKTTAVPTAFVSNVSSDGIASQICCSPKTNFAATSSTFTGGDISTDRIGSSLNNLHKNSTALVSPKFRVYVSPDEIKSNKSSPQKNKTDAISSTFGDNAFTDGIELNLNSSQKNNTPVISQEFELKDPAEENKSGVGNLQKNVIATVTPTFVSVVRKPNQSGKKILEIKIKQKTFETPCSKNISNISLNKEVESDKNIEPRNIQLNNSNKRNSELKKTKSVKESDSKSAESFGLQGLKNESNIKHSHEQEKTQNVIYFLKNHYPNTTFKFGQKISSKQIETSNNSSLNQNTFDSGVQNSKLSCVENKKLNATKESSQKINPTLEPGLSSKIISSTTKPVDLKSVKEEKIMSLPEVDQIFDKKNLNVNSIKNSEQDILIHNDSQVKGTLKETKELVNDEIKCFFSAAALSAPKQKHDFVDLTESKQKSDFDNLSESKQKSDFGNEIKIDKKNREFGVCEEKDCKKEEYKANIDRKKLDRLKQFLKSSCCFDNFWSGGFKKEKSPVVTSSRTKRKQEDESLCQRQRKLSKSCIVKNKNNEREIITIKNLKSPVKEELKCSNTTSKMSEAKDKLESSSKMEVDDKKSDIIREITNENSKLNVQPEIIELMNDFGLPEKQQKLNETKKGNKKSFKDEKKVNPEKNKSRRDSLKENAAKKGKLKLKNSPTKHFQAVKLFDKIKTFQKHQKYYCVYCGLLKPIDFFWLNIATEDLKCLNCFQKITTPISSVKKDVEKREKEKNAVKYEKIREGNKKDFVQKSEEKKDKFVSTKQKIKNNNCKK